MGERTRAQESSATLSSAGCRPMRTAERGPKPTGARCGGGELLVVARLARAPRLGAAGPTASDEVRGRDLLPHFPLACTAPPPFQATMYLRPAWLYPHRRLVWSYL